MDSNRVAGAARTFAGNARSAVGDLVGDAKSQVQGRVQASAGRAQQAVGEMSDHIQERPLAALLIASALGFIIGRLSAR